MQGRHWKQNGRSLTLIPDVVVFVGIAGGIKDVAIGDVVVSTKVYGYESSKAEQRFKLRPEIGLSAYSLEQRAKAEARKGNWLKRLALAPELTPRVFVAPIAAGEKVIASTQSEVFQFLQKNYGDAIAVEMHGLSFLETARATQRIQTIVIRGISDLIEGKNGDDIEPESVRQETASRHASAFAFELLASNYPSQDFFISYNRQDRPWAEWIAWVLESAGYTTIVQAWDFQTESNFVLDMQRATAQATQTIAILSKNYLQSEFTQPEWAAALAQDPTGKKRTLIPIRVGECSLSGMLAAIVYVDLVGMSEAEAEQTLLNALNHRSQPRQKPTFPRVDVLQRKTAFPGVQSRVQQIKEKSLQTQLDKLIADFEAVAQQLSHTTNSADRIRL
jgi:nucleoside phosphorylase